MILSQLSARLGLRQGQVAALNPFFVGVLSATLPLGQSIGIFAVIAYGILIVAALLLPETKGRVLTADA